MAIENNDLEITLESFIHNKYGNKLNIDSWNYEFKDWKMAKITKGEYYTFANSVIEDRQVVKTPLFRDNPIMWKVILRKKPNANYFVSSLNIVNHNITGSNNAEINSTSEESIKDKGHFIADSFDKFLLTENELKENGFKVQQFFGLGNKSNVSPQDYRANRNSKAYTGQLKFEQKILNFLNKSTNMDDEIYYEIEEVKFNQNVFGRRIFIKWPSENPNFTHVFIPEYRE